MSRYIDADALIRVLNAKADMAMGTPKEVFFSVAKMVDYLPAADVVPKREVEELIRENESLAKTVNEASEFIRKLRSKVKKSKSDVAREIFEEIDVLVDDWKHSHIQSIQFIAELAELKKKYTEVE